MTIWEALNLPPTNPWDSFSKEEREMLSDEEMKHLPTVSKHGEVYGWKSDLEELIFDAKRELDGLDGELLDFGDLTLLEDMTP